MIVTTKPVTFSGRELTLLKRLALMSIDSDDPHGCCEYLEYKNDTTHGFRCYKNCPMACLDICEIHQDLIMDGNRDEADDLMHDVIDMVTAIRKRERGLE